MTDHDDPQSPPVRDDPQSPPVRDDPQSPPVRDPMTGFWAKGNTLSKPGNGGGNPINRRMKELRHAVVEATSGEQVSQVMEAMRKAAVGGDVPAARVWLEYILGKPPQAISLESGDEGGKMLIELVHRASKPNAYNDDRNTRVASEPSNVHAIDGPV
jgi:hypothetical protein